MDVDRVRNACSESLLLSLLKEREMHGYEMCKEIVARSDGFFSLKHSTIYPLLHKLEKQGVVTSTWREFEGGKPRKVYRLTEAGHRAYRETTAQWRDLFLALRSLMPEVV